MRIPEKIKTYSEALQTYLFAQVEYEIQDGFLTKLDYIGQACFIVTVDTHCMDGKLFEDNYIAPGITAVGIKWDNLTLDIATICFHVDHEKLNLWHTLSEIDIAEVETHV